MIKYHRALNSLVIAELTSDNFIITQVQDALDLISDLGINDCNRIIIKESNLHDGVKLAIIGDFSKYRSTALQDFIRESNKGNMIFFVDNLDSALFKLADL
jgi:hypothetical protein